MSDFLQFDTDLLALLPPWYREVLEYQQICNAESQQFEALAQSIVSISDNFFFQTMDAASITQWEQIFKIVADPSTEDLAFRRARIINRISTQPPFTIWFLRKKLDELIGPGRWGVTVDYPNYTLRIEASAQDQAYMQEVAFTVGKIKPAHIVYVNTPLLTDSLLLNEEIRTSKVIWNYKLGSWGLGLLPFQSNTDQGVIKMPTTPSIQPEMLQNTAAFLATDIVSARINGTETVTALDKTASGNIVTIIYDVPASVGAAVTSVELLDANNDVLTSASVYIPVTSNTSMKHIITAQEGVNGNG